MQQKDLPVFVVEVGMAVVAAMEAVEVAMEVVVAMEEEAAAMAEEGATEVAATMEAAAIMVVVVVADMDWVVHLPTVGLSPAFREIHIATTEEMLSVVEDQLVVEAVLVAKIMVALEVAMVEVALVVALGVAVFPLMAVMVMVQVTSLVLPEVEVIATTF